MKRRNTIKLMALGTGAFFVTPLVSNLLVGCKTETKPKYANLEFFSEEDFAIVSVLVDIIIPESEDSPAASTVGVDTMIDHMIAGVYDSKQQDVFNSQFSDLKSYLNSAKDSNFIDLKPEDQKLIVTALLSEKNTSTKTARESFYNIKNQSINYYLNTEKVAKNNLNYLPVPGPYLPCVSLEELNGKAWAI
ncbi:gluconate 2-dehydrogenase subunit 3 family protein [Leeuwenhoekiella sp. MAR_2009_132]|uniref:gluconate 2-dehydrogenase subunit 3 family protein n=1 Tax=Leeuwenhoekiella sp. MAR_2009_132 TaxID=1392489 RepID=UPI0009E08F45|nr:gluconate 2-dehydrogenase subunit 3 family protein [Leeuwenhoekiella sp. MAR_2009_132]